MPNPVNEAAVESVELEEVSELLPTLFAEFDSAYNLFKKKAKKTNIANVTSGGALTTRAAWRVPMTVQGGSPIQVGTGDSTSLLRGNGSAYAAFALQPVWMFNVCEITHLAQMATEGKERGIVSIRTDELKRSLKQFSTGIEGLVNGDGSGTIDQIPTTGTVSSSSGSGAQTSYISGMNVAARFTDQQVVSVFPSIGGATRGVATISYVDQVSNTLYFSTALPSTGGATATGDYLVVQGGAGTAGSSVLGIQAWNVNSNVGSIAGVNRALYPGRLSTPTINLSGAQIVPSTFLRASILLGRALGADNEAQESGIWYGPPEQMYTFQSQWYSRMITQNKEGDSGMDTGRKNFAKTMGERDYQISWTANPNRVDMLVMDNWLFGELKEVGLYDFGGGNTIMPVPDVGTSNGTYLTNQMFVYECGFQLCNAAPRSGIFIQQASQLAV